MKSFAKMVDPEAAEIGAKASICPSRFSCKLGLPIRELRSFTQEANSAFHGEPEEVFAPSETALK